MQAVEFVAYLMVSRFKFTVLARFCCVFLLAGVFTAAGLLRLTSPTHLTATAPVDTRQHGQLFGLSSAFAGEDARRQRYQARRKAWRERRQARREARKARWQARRERRAAKKQARKERRAAKKQVRKERRAVKKQARKERRDAKQQKQAERRNAGKQAKHERRHAKRQARKERRVAKRQQRKVKRKEALEKEIKELKAIRQSGGDNGAIERRLKKKIKRRDRIAKELERLRKEAVEAPDVESDDRGERLPRHDGAPSGFDIMNPPDTAYEMVRQIGQSLSKALAPNETSNSPLGTANTLGAPASDAPPVEAALNPLAPVTAAPKPRTQRRGSRRGRRVSRSEIMPRFVPRRTSHTELIATNVSSATLQKALALGIKTISPSGGATKLVLPRGMDAKSALQALSAVAPDDTISYNYYYQLYQPAKGSPPQTPNDVTANGCRSADCDGRDIVGWTAEHATCAEEIKIGVIDTGIDADHPAFADRKIHFANAAAADKAPAPNAHATGVLSILAGDPKSKVHGLVPNARFVIADIFFEGEDGLPTTDTFSLMRALRLMDAHNVHVVNLSLSGPKDPLIEEIVEDLNDSGTILVAAAGNGGPGAPESYPAAYDTVLAVTAVGRNLRAFIHANHGDYIDVAAPGVDVLTALPGQNYGFQTGTSFAVPYVTAAVASIYRSLPIKSKSAFLERVSVQDLGAPDKDTIYGRGLMIAPATCAPPAVSWSVRVEKPGPHNDELSARVVQR